MEIYLVRHTAVDVEKGICYGQSDVGLKKTFHDEAKIVKNNIDQLREIKDFDKIYCSPLSRCRLLADSCGYPSPVFDDRIKEIFFGDWEMKSYEEINDPHLEFWFDNWETATPTNGESLPEMLLRVDHFLNELKDSGLERVIVFTHAGVIACTKILTGATDKSEAFNNLVNYGEVVRFDI